MRKFHCNLCINLLLIVSSCAISLGAMEIGLRLYGISGTGARVATRLNIYEFQKDLGWWPKAEGTYYRSDPYYEHFNYYNPARMPVTADSVHVWPDPKAPTIAFIGDSFVEGYYVPYEKSFVHLVDRAFTDYQVINLGVSGYNPSQYLIRARMELPKYNVRYIVVGFFAYNDVPGIDYPYMQGYNIPIFGDDLRTPLNTPLVKKSGNEGEVSLLVKIARKSAVYSVLRPFVYKVIHYFRPDIDESPDWNSLSPNPKDYAKALRLIAAIQDVAPGAKLIVAYIPYLEQLLYPDKFAENLAFFRSNCVALQMHCYVPDFVKEPADTLEPLYIGPKAAEGHFSELGSAKFAKFLIGVLHKEMQESDTSS